MEVGEGSAIARDMGRSWTTHTGGGGGGSSRSRQKKQPRSKKSLKPTWASMEVPDWDGVPDQATPSVRAATVQNYEKQAHQKKHKASSKKAQTIHSAGVEASATDAQPTLTKTDPDHTKRKKSKKKQAKKQQDSKMLKRKQHVSAGDIHIPQRQRSANSAIFSIDDVSSEASPSSKKRRRSDSIGETSVDCVARDAKAKAAVSAKRKQQREQQCRETPAVAAATELRLEEEQQLEKGAELLLRKLKSMAEAKSMTSADSRSSARCFAEAKAGIQKDKSLHTQYKKKLSGARFRYLNEMLYTSKGADSFRQFQEDPKLFDVYHNGFREQVEAWPVNPVNIILKRLVRLEQRHSRHDVGPSARFAVADFGCGDAAIAQSMSLCKSIVHSFDLVARNDWVTSADMAHVPLPEGTVNVAVFSLSLMGVNYIDYIVEAHRVLTPGGRLLIAEVHSRIDNFDQFEKTISNVGFQKKAEDKSNKMFVLYEFERLTGRPLTDLDRQTLTVAELKPCVYKRR